MTNTSPSFHVGSSVRLASAKNGRTWEVEKIDGREVTLLGGGLIRTYRKIVDVSEVSPE